VKGLEWIVVEARRLCLLVVGLRSKSVVMIIEDVGLYIFGLAL